MSAHSAHKNVVNSIRPTQKHKPNIIVIQAFPANHTLSEGIIEYLEDFFNVYFIDLPGFHPDIPPLESVTMNGYIKYVNDKVKELDLENFVLAGISFGFLLATKVKITNKKCLAVLGSGPFLGVGYLNFPIIKRGIFKLVVNIADKTGISEVVWQTKIFKEVLIHFLGNKSKSIIDVIIKEVDPNTFIKTAKILLNYKYKPTFSKDLPYVLLMNPRDTAVSFYKTLETFIDCIDSNKLRVIITNVEHYPKNPTYSYFKKSFTPNEIESLFNFVEFSNGYKTSELID